MQADSEAETRGLPPRDPDHSRETATVASDLHAQETLARAAPPEAEPMPIQIGSYEVLREIARGGMGVVYLARSQSLERKVALKVLRAGDQETSGGRERFQTEARVIARLRHPNIVGIHEVGTCSGRSYLAMDLIDGPSLRERLEAGPPFEPADAARLAQVVASALAYAHERSILHRDVKPGNILLSPEGPVLTDFGLAKDVSQIERSPTLSGEAIGTPAYMAPEQARGDLEAIDRRTDVYSLGATLYEMLTGQLPFRGNTIYDLLERLTTQEPARPRKLRPELERDLETIVLTCLAKDPARRYATAGALADDLERYLTHEPIEARRPGPIERTRLWLRRHSRIALTAAITLLVAAAFAVGEASVFVRRLRRERAGAEEALSRALAERDAAREALAARTALSPGASSSAAGLEALSLAEAAAGSARWEEAVGHYRRAFAANPILREVCGGAAAQAAGQLAQASPGDAISPLLSEAGAWLDARLGALPDEAARARARSALLSSPALAPYASLPPFQP